jgi:hypothetical protein
VGHLFVLKPARQALDTASPVSKCGEFIGDPGQMRMSAAYNPVEHRRHHSKMLPLARRELLGKDLLEAITYGAIAFEVVRHISLRVLLEHKKRSGF